MNLIIPLVLALLVSACTRGLDQKIDASNPKAWQASLAKIRAASSAEEFAQLEDAVRLLAVSDVSIGFHGGILGAMQRTQAAPLEGVAETVLQEVNGKTGREVVAAASKRRREQAEKQLTAQNAEMAALRKAKAEKDAAKDFLAKVEIQEPRIAILGSGAQRMGILDFKVANGSEETLASLFLRASVLDSEGKVLLTDEFTYRASPPIAATQTRSVRLPSSSPNKWNSPELAKQPQLTLQLQVENASTAAGSKLAASFTQKDADRLVLLEKQKPMLEAIVAAK